MALYNPLPIFPQTNDVIDPSQSNTFSWKIQGSSACIAYQITIYDMNNTIIYNGTKITLSTPVYGGNQLNVTFPATTTNCVAGNYYIHSIKTYYTTSLYSSTGNIIFKARTIPALSINMPTPSPYNLQYCTLTLNYSQAEGVGIKSFQYNWYDSNMNIIETYTRNDTSDTTWNIDGLLNGQTYYFDASITNQDNISVTSAVNEMTVSYEIIKFMVQPTAINMKDKNAVQLHWNVSQILGTPSNENIYQYIYPYLLDTNTGVHIDSGEYINFDASVEDEFTFHWVGGIDNGYTGDIVSLTNSDNTHTYILTFDGTNFIYSIDGVTASYNMSSYRRNYWFITLLPTQAIYTFIDGNELFPSSTLYPSDTLYPLMMPDDA